MLAGCSWRLESEPAPTPTADAVQAARDLAARNEAAVIAALGEPAAASSGREALQTLEGVAAPTHLNVLGGVYEPYPSALPSPDPSPSPSPSVGPSPEPTPDLRAAVLTARDDALALAFEVSDTEAGFLAGSMGFTHAFAAWYASVLDAQAAGIEIPVIQERTLPGRFGESVPMVPETTGISADAVAELALRHDQARFVYEVIAARDSGADRESALANALKHRERSDALVALCGIDLRTPVYELPDAKISTLEDRYAARRLTEQGLGWAYLALTDGVDPSERAWLMSAAFDAYSASALIPGFSVAEFPVLPGAATP
jgi:hypothetical protein